MRYINLWSSVHGYHKKLQIVKVTCIFNTVLSSYMCCPVVIESDMKT